MRVALRRAGEAAPAVVLTVKAEFLAQPDGSEITVAFLEVGVQVYHVVSVRRSPSRGVYARRVLFGAYGEGGRKSVEFVAVCG